jgi:hypothetical protein
MQLTANFHLSEFQRASARPLTAAHVEKARRFAVHVLQPLRREFGPILITSFLRDSGSGTHRDGDAVDMVLADWPVTRDGHSEAHRRAAEFAGTYLTHGFGRLIHELAAPGQTHDHLHMTLPGVQGSTGLVLVEQRSMGGERVFLPGYVTPELLALLATVGLFFVVAWAM